MSNVTKLPDRNDDEPRDMLRFADNYLENLFFGSGWKRLAGCLMYNGDKIPKSMHKFVCEMNERQTRPTRKQLATMIGLMVSAQAERIFDGWHDDGTKKGANVVPIGVRK